MTTASPNWLQRNAQPILAVGTMMIVVVGLITATASAWNALDSKADRTAARVEDKIDTHVGTIDARIGRLESKIDASIVEMREDRRQMLEERRIWLEQFNRVDERIDALDRRALVPQASLEFIALLNP